MKCFYHGEVDAVALCKSCGHALCHDCAFYGLSQFGNARRYRAK